MPALREKPLRTGPFTTTPPQRAEASDPLPFPKLTCNPPGTRNLELGTRTLLALTDRSTFPLASLPRLANRSRISLDRTVNMKTRRKSPRRRKKLSISKLARFSLVDLHKVWTKIYTVPRTLTRYVE